MVPDRQKVRTDGRNGRTDGHTDDAKTISLRLRRGITKQNRKKFLLKPVINTVLFNAQILDDII